jgi:predicted enzyme related to lactoylglutathione lyase
MPANPPGTPCWVDLSSPDTDASAGFYGELFGWSATEPGPAEETGGYRTFEQDGKSIAGLMGHMQEDQPTAWSTYIGVDDADETAQKIADAGGSTVVAPMDVMEIGRMAFFADPGGAVFGIWQPKTFEGADLFNEPVSLVWNEVLTRDPEAVKAFYPAVFGWGLGNPGFEGAPESYVVWEREADGRGIGGMMDITGAEATADVPPHWNVCFEVADCVATAARCAELGGSVLMEPVSMPIGRFAVLMDPQGAAFNVMQSA